MSTRTSVPSESPLGPTRPKSEARLTPGILTSMFVMVFVRSFFSPPDYQIHVVQDDTYFCSPLDVSNRESARYILLCEQIKKSIHTFLQVTPYVWDLDDLFIVCV